MLHKKKESVLKHDSLQPLDKNSYQDDNIQLSYKLSGDSKKVESVLCPTDISSCKTKSNKKKEKNMQVCKKEDTYSALLQVDSKNKGSTSSEKDTVENLLYLKSDSVHEKYKQFDIQNNEMHEDAFEHEKTPKEKHDHRQNQSDNENEIGNIGNDNELSLKMDFKIKENTNTKKNASLESDSDVKSIPHVICKSAKKLDIHLSGNEKEIHSDSHEKIRKTKEKQRHRRKESRKDRDIHSNVEIKQKVTSSTEEIKDGEQVKENFLENIQDRKTVPKDKEIEKVICKEQLDFDPESKSIIAGTNIEYEKFETYSKNTNNSDISYLKALQVTKKDKNCIKDSCTGQDSDESIDIVDIENLDEDNCYVRQSDQLRQVSETEESMLACSCARMRIWHRQPKHFETNITIEHCEIQKEGIQRQTSGDYINIDENHTSDASENVSDSQTYDETYCAFEKDHVFTNTTTRVADNEKQTDNKEESSETSTNTENSKFNVYNENNTTVGMDPMENVTNKTVELIHSDVQHLDETESCHQGLKQGYKIPKLKPCDKQHDARHKEDKKDKRSEGKELKHKHKSRSSEHGSERTKDDKHDKEKRFDERSNETNKQRTVSELRKLHRCISLHDDESSKIKKIKKRSISSDERITEKCNKSDLQYHGESHTSQRQKSHSTEFRESKRE
ncbi:RBBP6 [Mytilus coruscus]|uniref:RBBP6 n=1 Tax=Mytilus coruscus TaxID=42192 RepID=A0A6J8DL74_MYTCO|nr:RBBP6 [Mytilus coruscus]